MQTSFALIVFLLVVASLVLASDFERSFNLLRKNYALCKSSCGESQKKRCIPKCLAQSFFKRNPKPNESLDHIFSEVLFESTATAATPSDDNIVQSDSERSTNSAGVNLIKSFEGFRSCVYKDAVGKPTIGYGHLIKRGEKFTCITEARAVQILKRDMGSAEGCVSGAVKRRLSDNQFAALVSFTFNLGCGALQSSTLLKKVNGGAKASEVCAQLARWNKAGGRVLPGLTRRRTAECNLYKK